MIMKARRPPKLEKLGMTRALIKMHPGAFGLRVAKVVNLLSKSKPELTVSIQYCSRNTDSN